MLQFSDRYQDRIFGVLSGFDRMVFRGTLMPLVRDGGMYAFLCRAHVRLLDFKKYVAKVTERLKSASLRVARESDRPIRYLTSSRQNKEALARKILAEDPVDEGLICAFTVIEPCLSFEYHRSDDPAERGLKLRPRKCLHIYQYFLDREFGFCSARIQTWFPFNVQICLNGREWLSTTLARQGADFLRDGNCVYWVEDVRHAQGMLDRQLARNWPWLLDRIARRLNPIHRQLLSPWPQDYYWTNYQTEWASDVLFESPEALAAVYPSFTRHATVHFQSQDVMRFLGRKAHGNYLGEIVSSFKNRSEGVRVKHWAKGNSVKMYDKAGSVLRIETTIAKPGEFKVFRPTSTDPEGDLDWRPMRKGVADIHRRAEVSHQANSRYLEALSVVEESSPLHELLDQVTKRKTVDGRRYRALRIGDAKDIALLRTIAREDINPAGFRNRDIRERLHPAKRRTAAETRKLSARVGRQLRLLRAHGIIKKLPKSHRYRLTTKGMNLTAAITAMREASVKDLLGIAA